MLQQLLSAKQQQKPETEKVPSIMEERKENKRSYR
jgi:hypothetical protein